MNLPRATFVAWWKQSVCKQHLFLDYFATLVMTKNQDGHTTFAMTTLISFTITILNLSLRWSEKIFPRSLNVNLPRATFVAWWKQSVCKQHLFLDYFATLVMTKNQDGRTAFAMTSCLYTCPPFLSLQNQNLS